MTKVSMNTKLNVSADEAWRLIGGFNTLPDWHPAVENSELTEEGQTRTLSLAGGGGTIVEKLEKMDDGSRTYSYSIVDSPLPVANYSATIKVSGEGDDCTIEWTGEFDAVGPENEAVDAISGIFQAGFDNLNKMFGR
jgi:hypothetical protein